MTSDLSQRVAAVTRAVARSVGDLPRRLIYLPGNRPLPPIDAVLPGGRPVNVTTEDDVELEAWFLPASARAARATDDSGGPSPAVLVLHGNGGDRADRSPLAQEFARRGLSVLLVDYRGYGGNPGRPHEDGLYADARAARETLTRRPDVDESRVVYFGESLGAAVAIALAAEAPPAALVLRSPFTSLLDVARVHYPFVPDAALPDTYPSLSRIGDVDAPVFVAAGDADRIVPFEQSKRLYDAAPDPKHFHAVPAADHNDLELFTGAALLDAVAAFLADHGVLPSRA